MAYNNKIVTNTTGSAIIAPIAVGYLPPGQFASNLKSGQRDIRTTETAAYRSNPNEGDYYTNMFIQPDLRTDTVKDPSGNQLSLYLSSDGSLYRGYFYATATGDFFTGKYPGSNSDGKDSKSTDFNSVGKIPLTKSDILLVSTSNLAATQPPVGRDPEPSPPTPDHLDYLQSGHMFRHFAKKRNESTTKAYMEISAATYQLLFDEDPKINFRDWDIRRIRWEIGSMNAFKTYVKNKNTIFNLGRGTYNPTGDRSFSIATGKLQIITPAKLAELYTLNSVAFTNTQLEMKRRGEVDELSSEIAGQFQPPWPGFKEFFSSGEFVDESWVIFDKKGVNAGISWDRLWVPARYGNYKLIKKQIDFKYFTEFWVDLFEDATPIAFNPITSKINLSKGPLTDPGYPFLQVGNPNFRINVKRTYGLDEVGQYRKEIVNEKASSGFNVAQVLPGIPNPTLYTKIAEEIHSSPYATSTMGIFLKTSVEPYASTSKFYEANSDGTFKLPKKEYGGPFYMTYRFSKEGVKYYKGNVPTYGFDSRDSKRNPLGRGTTPQRLVKEDN